MALADMLITPPPPSDDLHRMGQTHAHQVQFLAYWRLKNDAVTSNNPRTIEHSIYVFNKNFNLIHTKLL